MPLFAFPAYLKSLKDMRKPGGPQEMNTWEACEKTNIAPQTLIGVKCRPSGQQIKPKAYSKAVAPRAIDPRFCIWVDYRPRALPKVDNDLIIS